jgi:hypothetical protein
VPTPRLATTLVMTKVAAVVAATTTTTTTTMTMPTSPSRRAVLRRRSHLLAARAPAPSTLSRWSVDHRLATEFVLVVTCHVKQAHPRAVDGIGSAQRPDADGYFYADAAQHWSAGYAKKKSEYASCVR